MRRELAPIIAITLALSSCSRGTAPPEHGFLVTPSIPKSANSDPKWEPMPIGIPQTVRFPGGHLTVGVKEGSYAKGAPIAINLEWSGSAQNTAFTVSLERDISDQERHSFRYDGPVGTFPTPGWSERDLRSRLEVGNSGKTIFTWPGKGFICSPTDYEKVCEIEPEIGRYKIVVGMVGAETSPGDRSGPISPYAKREVIAVLRTSAFRITGDPDFISFKSLLFSKVRRFIDSHRLGMISYPEAGTASDILVRKEGGSYCFDVSVEKPFVSPVIFCYPRNELVNENGVEKYPASTMHEVPFIIPQIGGTMSREEAVLAAQKIATPPYLKRVRWPEATSDLTAPQSMGVQSGQNYDDPMATTYISNPVAGLQNRPELDGWIVVVHEMMAGGTLPGNDPARFQDQVMVFAGTRGRVCIIETKTRNTTFTTNAITVKPKCA